MARDEKVAEILSEANNSELLMDTVRVLSAGYRFIPGIKTTAVDSFSEVRRVILTVGS